MQSSYELKDRFPYWWKIKEKQDYEREMERLVYEAKYEIKQYIDMKMKEIEAQIKEIEEKVNQSSINIETKFNNQPVTNNSNINREVKKIVIEEIEKALKK